MATYPPETYRKAKELRLRGKDGAPMSINEIAQVLAVPDTTVYQWTKHLRPEISAVAPMKNLDDCKHMLRCVKGYLAKTSENSMPELVARTVEDLLDALQAMVESNQRTFDAPAVYVYAKEASDKMQIIMKNAARLDPKHVKRQRDTRDSLLRLARKHLEAGDTHSARQFVKQATHTWMLTNDQKKEFQDMIAPSHAG